MHTKVFFLKEDGDKKNGYTHICRLVSFLRIMSQIKRPETPHHIKNWQKYIYLKITDFCNIS